MLVTTVALVMDSMNIITSQVLVFGQWKKNWSSSTLRLVFL